MFRFLCAAVELSHLHRLNFAVLLQVKHLVVSREEGLDVDWTGHRMAHVNQAWSHNDNLSTAESELNIYESSSNL